MHNFRRILENLNCFVIFLGRNSRPDGGGGRARAESHQGHEAKGAQKGFGAMSASPAGVGAEMVGAVTTPAVGVGADMVGAVTTPAVGVGADVTGGFSVGPAPSPALPNAIVRAVGGPYWP